MGRTNGGGIGACGPADGAGGGAGAGVGAEAGRAIEANRNHGRAGGCWLAMISQNSRGYFRLQKYSCIYIYRNNKYLNEHLKLNERLLNDPTIYIA